MDTNLQKYLAFVKTVETGTFSKAAELLHYSQSGVSRMIQDMEKEWSVSLLERGKNGVRLTSDGMKLLPFARSVCEEYEKLQNEVNLLAGLSEGLIRIAAVPGMSEYLGSVWEQFRENREGMELEVRTGTYKEVENRILSGEADLGFTRIPTENDLETGFLIQDSLYAVIPSFPDEEVRGKKEKGESAAKGKTDKSLTRWDREALEDFRREGIFPVASYCEYPVILPGMAAGEDAKELFRNCDISPRISITLSGEEGILSYVRRGLGISLLSGISLRTLGVDPENREGNPFLTVLPLDVPAYRNIGYALRNRKAASFAVQKLLEKLD